MQMSSKSFSFLFFSTEISITLAGCTTATTSASRCFLRRDAAAQRTLPAEDASFPGWLFLAPTCSRPCLICVA